MFKLVQGMKQNKQQNLVKDVADQICKNCVIESVKKIDKKYVADKAEISVKKDI